jgi:hypothetical protein
MSICTLYGGAAWFAPTAWAGDAASRFLLTDGTTRFLAAMLFGELVLWDLPCAIWIKALRRPDSIIHHFAMAAVAFNAAWLAPVYYGVFYLGLIELSTIPLNIHEYFAHAARAAERSVSPSAASRAAVVRFRALRDGWQAAAALSFVAVRGLLFTHVSARRFFPEILPLIAPSAAAHGLRAPLVGHAVSVLGFNVLQLYWLALLFSYTLKNGVGGERPGAP